MPTHLRFFIASFGAVIGVVFALAMSGCATDSKSDMRLGTEPETPLTTADPSSYGADGFTFNKYQKKREPNDFMFYFKRCSLNDSRSYYSRTSYWCSDP